MSFGYKDKSGTAKPTTTMAPPTAVVATAIVRSNPGRRTVNLRWREDLDAAFEIDHPMAVLFDFDRNVMPARRDAAFAGGTQARKVVEEDQVAARVDENRNG